MKLVAFDGDDTLWSPLSGLWLSDRAAGDPDGWPHFTYTALPEDPLTARRDDGALFGLRPEARSVMEELHSRGVLVGVASYNHESNVRAILGAFGLLPLIDYIAAEWHRDKGLMLKQLVEAARADSRAVSLSDSTLIDDDHYGLYARQCREIGAGFACFGKDLTDLRQVLDLIDG